MLQQNVHIMRTSVSRFYVSNNSVYCFCAMHPSVRMRTELAL